MTSATTPPPTALPATHDDHVHAVPLRVLAAVFALLLGFTFLTVAATWVNLGHLNLCIALIIAFVKALLVCLYFMHLRYDSLLYSLILAVALGFVVLFIGAALTDTTGYQANIDAALESAALPAP
jgi:cytochrome c oxidase subunit 4